MNKHDTVVSSSRLQVVLPYFESLGKWLAVVRERQLTPRGIIIWGSPEQARWVKTVKVRVEVAKPCTDQTVGCYQGRPWIAIAIDWVTCRSTLGSWLNVQSGYCKSQEHLW